MLAAGCAPRREAPTTTQQAAAQQTTGAQTPTAPSAQSPATAPVSVASVATTVDGYKRDLAARILQESAGQVYEGAPPPLLRSIVVLSMTVDAAGNLANARVVRDNGDDQMTRAALESVRRAAPFRRPPGRLLSRGRVEFLETWLFRDDGRFQLRSLAQAQQE